MKKLFSIFFTTVLLLNISLASAESISFRNGIVFGDDEATVRAKEDVDLFVNDNFSQDDTLQSKEITWAGLKGSYAYYRFDNDGKLYEVAYSPNISSTDDLNTLDAALIKKYGEPLGYLHGETSDITGFAFSRFQHLSDDSLTESKWVIYREWFTKNEEGQNIKIDFIYGYFGIFSLYAVARQCFISYKLVSEVSDGTTNDVLGPSDYDYYKDEEQELMNSI